MLTPPPDNDDYGIDARDYFFDSLLNKVNLSLNDSREFSEPAGLVTSVSLRLLVMLDLTSSSADTDSSLFSSSIN